MPHLDHGNAKIYYEVEGDGPAVITIHGLNENTLYWSLPGVTARLAERYRVVSMDMRGHGRTKVKGDPKGFDPDTMAADFDALADALGIDTFHLLSHATGGMVAARYGMRRSSRLRSLILTDCSSNTRVGRPEWDPPPARQVAGRERRPNIFTFKVSEHPDAEEQWTILDQVFRLHDDREALAEFRRTFYADPDPRVDELRTISCPTLVLVGEHDVMFREPSDLMAREIPDAKLVVMPGVGHMTAVEATDDFTRIVSDFLAEAETRYG